MNQTSNTPRQILGTPKHYSLLGDGKFNALVPSISEGLMAGAVAARQDRTGTITLFYSDNTTESRFSSKDLITDFEDNFFSVVSFVQAGRAQSLAGGAS